MQTFLPYANFNKTAKILDYRRLGKQRVEAMQIINTLEQDSRWRHHPAVLMWAGFENCLKIYCNVMIEEWKGRGYVNNMKLYDIKGPITKPYWMGDERLHLSHRSRLLQKNYEYYRDQFPEDTPLDLEYYWPVRKGV